MKKKVLLVGFFGAPNLGDEAVALAAMKALPREKFEFTVASSNVEITARFLDFPCQVVEARYYRIEWKELQNIIRLVRKSDVVLLPGGGVWQDVHGLSLVHHCATYVLAACLYDIPVVALGMGVGPIKTSHARKLIEFFLKYAYQVTVRDKVSLDYVKTMSDDHLTNVRLTCDSAFVLKKEDRPVPGKKVGLVFRRWAGLNIDGIVKLVNRLKADGKNPVLIICEPAVDQTFYDEIVSQCGAHVEILNPNTVSQAIDCISQLEFLISMRLHPLIFAISAGVPVVAVDYDHKISEVMNSFDLGRFVFALDFNPEEVLKAVAQAKPVDKKKVHINYQQATGDFQSVEQAVTNRTKNRLGLRVQALFGIGSVLIKVFINRVINKLKR